MSRKTWEDGFYPIAADSHISLNSSNADRVRLTLLKWKGALKKNLEKHGGQLQDGGTVVFKGGKKEPKRFYFNSETCALCAKASPGCCECPLYEARGKVTCFSTMNGEDISPYFALQNNRDPKPMIKWLKKTLKYVKEQE